MTKKSSKRSEIHPAILILFFILSVFSIWAFVNEITRKPCGISTPSTKSTVSKTEISDCDKVKKILLKLADFQLHRKDLREDVRKYNKKLMTEFSQKKCDIKTDWTSKDGCNLDDMYENSMKKLEFKKDTRVITDQSYNRMLRIQNCLMTK